MEKILRNTLTLLQLSTKEIQFLEALYFLGPTTIHEVAKKARLQRSTAYLVMSELLEKELIIEDFKEYKKTISAVEPRTLLRKLAARQRLLKRTELELQEHLPEMDAYFQTTPSRPHIQYFEGKTALLSVWNDVLQTKSEILLWTNQATENLFFTKALHEKFIKERVAKRIPIRALAVNNRPGKSLLERDEQSLRHSKLLPIQTTFRAETYIYENKIAILDYHNDITGIIIESEAVTSTQRAIFEMTWQGLDNGLETRSKER